MEDVESTLVHFENRLETVRRGHRLSTRTRTREGPRIAKKMNLQNQKKKHDGQLVGLKTCVSLNAVGCRESMGVKTASGSVKCHSFTAPRLSFGRRLRKNQINESRNLGPDRVECCNMYLGYDTDLEVYVDGALKPSLKHHGEYKDSTATRQNAYYSHANNWAEFETNNYD